MIEINQNSTISPWKYTINGEVILLTNGEAIRLLQNECYNSIRNQDLVKIIDIHKDLVFLKQRSKEWFRTFPNRNSVNKQLLDAEHAIIILTEGLKSYGEYEQQSNTKRRKTS